MSTSQLQKATQVDARKQLLPSEYVTFDGVEKDGLRVMFVGNSITLHGACPSIGWNNCWGMAASSEEKDYVHRCYAHIREKDPEAAFCICQAAIWEWSYKTGETVLEQFKAAREFEADIILIKLSANSPLEDFDIDVYEEQFDKLLAYLNKTGRAKIVVATEFYVHPAEEAVRHFAQKKGWPLCPLSDLCSLDEMKAIGLFEHDGVANHPGDYGMQVIAERLCQILESMEIW